MAPMKKMSLSWVIAIVMILHRKMGEHTDRQRGTEPDVGTNRHKIQLFLGFTEMPEVQCIVLPWEGLWESG